MMRFIATLTLVLASALAAPQLNVNQGGQEAQAYSSQSQTTAVPILKFEDSQPGDGSFKYAYETGNGIKLEGSGFTKKAVVPQFDEAGVQQPDAEKDVLVQVGSYSYTAPDGQVITVNYIADENGFQPQGDHIPTPPSVPEAIVKSLSQQANNQQQQQQQTHQFGQLKTQPQQQFGQQQGRAFNTQTASASALPSPQASNFPATTPQYPLDKHDDRFADFSGGSL